MPKFDAIVLALLALHSSLNFHSLPECDVILDILCCIFRHRIKPGGILVDLTANDNVVIARRSLPTTNRMGFARLEEFFPDRVVREILVAFDVLSLLLPLFPKLTCSRLYFVHL
jgi:hypothetical protein